MDEFFLQSGIESLGLPAAYDPGQSRTFLRGPIGRQANGVTSPYRDPDSQTGIPSALIRWAI